MIKEQYQAAAQQGKIESNSMQLKVVDVFEDLIEKLQSPQYFQWIFGRKSTLGVYLYGSVGAGKTYLMDLFYEAVPTPYKERAHFHAFMQQIHVALKQNQGQADPLKKIVKNLSQKIRLLCLDEFMVDDIANAMILGEFLKHLFEQGIVLVTTSNVAPDLLYLRGLQRGRFLPAIALLKTHCEVMQLMPEKDYRFIHNTMMQTYMYPLNEETQRLMDQQYHRLINIPQSPPMINTIEILGRKIPVIACANRIVWFDFNTICQVPRCSIDYLEIAKHYDIIFISNVQTQNDNAEAQMFLLIQLIDVLYDHRIRVVISAAEPVSQLYSENEVAIKAGVARTKSRLYEMQTALYWRA